MPLDTALDEDRRGSSTKIDVARGHLGRTKSLTIANGQTQKTDTFEAYGRFHSFLLEIPALDGGAATLGIAIYPADVNDADAKTGVAAMKIVEVTGLANTTDHYIIIAENTTNNLDRFLFGKHRIALTSSVAVNDDRIIKFTPILPLR
ncbi:MAG: hypothetical protein V3V19_11315 [Cocleimonas sp.]